MATTYEWMAHFAQSAGVLYFIALFVAVLFYALRPRNKDTFDRAAQAPLRED
jgi:cytochrome c oxidase cbb3-type subunit 4